MAELEVRRMGNCGMREFVGLERVGYSPERIAKMIAENIEATFYDEWEDENEPDYEAGACIFTVAWDHPTKPRNLGINGYEEPRKKGDMMENFLPFMEFVEEKRLGVIRKLPQFINPNHNSRVVTYMWYIDGPALTDWYIQTHGDTKANWQMEDEEECDCPECRGEEW